MLCLLLIKRSDYRHREEIKLDRMTKDTILLDATYPNNQKVIITQAAEILRQGGIVAIPTETVYGLAADASDIAAVAAVFAAKGRPPDNPLIVHIAQLEQLPQVVASIPALLLPLAKRFWPGPLTLICPRGEGIPAITAGGLDTVAVRMPAHPVARAIIEASAPLAAPSANLSGHPSPTTAQHCIQDLWGKVDAIVDGGSCVVGVESTVLSLVGEVPTLLRPGGVTLEDLEQTLGRVALGRGVLEQLAEGEKVLSPGLKYRHYAPQVDVELVEGSSQAYGAYICKRALTEHNIWALCFEEDQKVLGEVPRLCYGKMEDDVSQAEGIFRALRQLDQMSVGKILIHAPCRKGLGLAVYNRLIRAAGFQVTYL